MKRDQLYILVFIVNAYYPGSNNVTKKEWKKIYKPMWKIYNHVAKHLNYWP